MRAVADTRWAAFWKIFLGDGGKPARLEKVAEYVIHRIDKGAPLKEIVQEEYVRRNASPDEVAEIVEDVRIVTAARDKMREALKNRPPRRRHTIPKPANG